MKKSVQKKQVSKINSFVHKINSFAKEKPYFVIALIISIIIILLFTYAYYLGDGASEKAGLAKQIYLDLNMVTEEYKQNLLLEMANPVESTLDDDYLYSIQDDLEWIQAKNKEIFYSKPSNDVFAKEAALSMSAEYIIQLNVDFSFEIGEANKEEKIATALVTDVNTPVLFNDDELMQLFENERERKVFLSTAKEIFEDYVRTKKLLIQNSTSLERKYVEAKKIVLLSYSNAVITDMNYLE
ncbi:MAG: hypothetical protein WC821_01230 [archaeon]|jgi:hypothetical protein